MHMPVMHTYGFTFLASVTMKDNICTFAPLAVRLTLTGDRLISAGLDGTSEGEISGLVLLRQVEHLNTLTFQRGCHLIGDKC